MSPSCGGREEKGGGIGSNLCLHLASVYFANVSRNSKIVDVLAIYAPLFVTFFSFTNAGNL